MKVYNVNLIPINQLIIKEKWVDDLYSRVFLFHTRGSIIHIDNGAWSINASNKIEFFLE